MQQTTILSIVGVIGTLLGALIGASISYKGTMNAVNKQIEHENSKVSKEKNENEEYIQRTILAFIKNEIEINYNILSISRSKNLPVERKPLLQFVEFEKAKYKLLEDPTDLVKEIIKLYLLFYDIQLLRPNFGDAERTNKMNQILAQKQILDAHFENISWNQETL